LLLVPVIAFVPGVERFREADVPSMVAR